VRSNAAYRLYLSVHNLMTNEKDCFGQSEAVFPLRLRSYLAHPTSRHPSSPLAKPVLRLAPLQRLQCLVVQLAGDRQVINRLKLANCCLGFWSNDAID